MLGDKLFGSDAIRGLVLDDHEALTVTPNRSRRAEPSYWDDAVAEAYQDRKRVEREFVMARRFRRFATRYDKLKAMSLGVVQRVFDLIHVRRLARKVNTVSSKRFADAGVFFAGTGGSRLGIWH